MHTTIDWWTHLARLVRWSARLASIALLWLVIVIVVGDGGPPNILLQPTPVQLELVALGLMLIGLVVGWVREKLGGLTVLLGLASLNAVELTVNHRLALGAFPLFAVPGILFLLSAWIQGREKQLTAE